VAIRRVSGGGGCVCAGSGGGVPSSPEIDFTPCSGAVVILLVATLLLG
jgi:hypothetical protein